MFHAILNSLNIDTILNLAYLIGPLYYVFSFKNTFKLYKRREKIKNYKKLNYNPMTVKINYVKYWLETLWLSKDNFEKDIMNKVVINNQSYLDNLMKSEKGFIFALPHLGNWEMAIPVGKSIGLDLVAVAEPLDNKRVLNWFKSLREQLGCEIVLGGKGQNTFDLLQDKILNGKHICLLSERSINKSGVGVEFFGEVAAFPKGPVALALKTEVPIVPAAFLKLEGRYTLVFDKPFYVPLFDNEAQSIQQGLKVLAKSFEDLIALDINQWHSIQPVWANEY
tara:strand:+ start:97 stop:936 length:840 start_codon:yes stop_codon:yes gene_type:complete